MGISCTGCTIMIMTQRSYKSNILKQFSFIQTIQLYQYYIKFINKIDSFLQSNKQLFSTKTKQQQTSCFMKLSTRSPKDFGYKYSQHQRKTISQKLTQRLIKKFPPLYHQQQQQKKTLTRQFINEIYTFFLQLSKQKFRIKSSLDFINIFSSSERIVIDISDMSFINDSLFDAFELGNYQKAEDKFIQLWAREWKDFQWYQELRCFYYDYELTGISQYDQRCYFPQIQSKQKIIKQQISKFFTRIKPALQKLSLSEGVMDIVLFGVGDYYNHHQEIKQIKLIQINVFNHNSRGSLFSWDRDLTILTKKPDNLEIRLLTEPIKINRYQLIKLMGMIDKGTEEIINLTMKELHMEQLWNHYQ